MIRSRMFTPLFRLFVGWAIVATVLAAIFGIASTADHPFTFGGDFPWIHNDDLVNTVVGPVTLGWKGPVGNHVGYLIWLSIATVSAFLGGLLIAFRDADPEAEAEAVHTESVPLTRAPSGANYWPVIGAFGVGMVAIGWVSNNAVLIAGLGVLVVSAVTWTFRAWADRATGDDEVNYEIYHRFIDPLRIPVLSILAIGLVVFGISRVLLTVDRLTAIYIFLGAFVAFGLIFTLIAFLPSASKPVLTALFLIIGALILIFGVVAAVRGERNFSEEETPTVQTGGHGEGGLAPLQVPGQVPVQVSN